MTNLKLPRRQFLHLAAGAAALPAVSRIASAQTYPTQPVRIIVPYAPAGGSDITARLIGQWLSERLGHQFLVENRPGGGSNIGTEAVVRSPPNGYTLLVLDNSPTINATLYDRLNFNFIRDIAPVAGITRGPLVMAVPPSLSSRTVAEFISDVKANPGKINFASAGIGNITHMQGELFKLLAGINMQHVPYRGAGPALTDLIGGQVQVMFVSLVASLEHIRAGRLRALAVAAPSRLEILPDIPTVGEYVSGYEGSAWFGVGVPKNTPAEIIDKLNKEINAGLADPSLKARFADLGGIPMAMTAAEFGKFIASETEKWRKVIRAGNIKPE